jgi:hypothetical protein
VQKGKDVDEHVDGEEKEETVESTSNGVELEEKADVPAGNFR